MVQKQTTKFEWLPSDAFGFHHAGNPPSATGAPLTTIHLEIHRCLGCNIILKCCPGTGVEVCEIDMVSLAVQLAVDQHLWQREVQATPVHACSPEHYPAWLVPGGCLDGGDREHYCLAH